MNLNPYACTCTWNKTSINTKCIYTNVCTCTCNKLTTACTCACTCTCTCKCNRHTCTRY